MIRSRRWRMSLRDHSQSQGIPVKGLQNFSWGRRKPIDMSSMNRERHSETRRFTSSAVIALPVTVALLYLMTRLIMPGEHDRIVTRMIQNIELHRDIRPADQPAFLPIEPAQAIQENQPSAQADLAAEGPQQTQNEDTLSDESAENDARVRFVDWWAEARELIKESDEEAFKRWLLEQGHEDYVSIMQGPIPITNSVQAKLAPTQEDATGYSNTFGDMEYKISENCVATTQVAARLDQSDLARALPMIISCKPSPKQKILFYRYDRE